MLAFLVKIKPSGVCIFWEYAKKKNFTSKLVLEAKRSVLMTRASSTGGDRFISSEY